MQRHYHVREFLRSGRRGQTSIEARSDAVSTLPRTRGAVGGTCTSLYSWDTWERHWRHRTRRERRLPEGHFKPEEILNLVIVAVKQVSLV